ncbi:thioester domain-containing protein [Streptomyces sp. NPDC006733]|uniref:thioester domain-containing protein n=1 Tax=Streptomyces sp. NPDC006733 TaxID=3155460 RepID=UPI0033DB4F95
MFKIQRRGAARLAAAGLVTGLLAAGTISGAGTALADDVAPAAGGATAVLKGLQKGLFGDAIYKDGKGETQTVSAGLFRMDAKGGGTLQSYCIDIGTHTAPGANYQEASWGASSLHDAATANQINWILQHSYPQVNDLAALAKSAGANKLSAEQAATGTQVAIWRFSDHADVTAKNPKAEKLADYLTEQAKDAATATEPKASLSVTPTDVSGKAGEKLGPVTVHTNAASAKVRLAGDAPDGVKLVDKTGKPVTNVTDGTELFFDVPAGTADGKTKLIVEAATKIPVGRVFTSVGEVRKQTQILAGSSESSVSAPANASWVSKGAVLAVSAKVNCAKGGVDVTVTNEGDKPFTFPLGDKSYTLEAGKSQTVTVPAKEDASYTIVVPLPDGTTKTFTGVLDCKATGPGTPTPTPTATPSTQPSPASAGTTTGTNGTTGGDLAQTGGSSATPMIAGIAVALVVVGGGAVFFLRRKKSSATPAGQ